MFQCSIQITDDQKIFRTGDKVAGVVNLTVPSKTPLENVDVSFRCLSEVNWTEADMNEYFERHYIHKENIDMKGMQFACINSVQCTHY